MTGLKTHHFLKYPFCRTGYVLASCSHGQAWSIWNAWLVQGTWNSFYAMQNLPQNQSHQGLYICNNLLPLVKAKPNLITLALPAGTLKTYARCSCSCQVVIPHHDPNAADKAQCFSKTGPLYPAYVMHSIWKGIQGSQSTYPCHWSWLLTKDPIDILWTFGAGMVSSAQLDSEELNLKNLATWACLKKCGKPW